MNKRPIRSTVRLLLPVSVLIALGASAWAADLTIDREAAVPFALDWGAKKASAKIVNFGDSPAGEFRVRLGISHPSSLAATRPQSQIFVSVAALAPGERIAITVDIADFKHRGIDPLSLSTGLFDVRIDYDDAVEETNENNNAFTHVF